MCLLKVTYLREQELLLYETSFIKRKYRVYQIYGQKYVQLMNPRAEPEAATEVYVCNIPRNIAIEKLFKFFIRCGEIYKIRLLMDFSGCNRGRCYVQYQTFRASREAICCLHEEDIENGNRVVVMPSLNNNQLVLRSIPSWIPPEFVVASVRNHIGEGLLNVAIKKCTNLEYRNNCLCTYRDHIFAITAHKKCWPFINIGGIAVEVNWAIPKILRYSVNLYFTNFSVNMTKREFFNAVLAKINVRMLIKFRMENLSGYVTFVNAHAMRKGQGMLSNLVIQGYKLQFSERPFRGMPAHIQNYSDNDEGPNPALPLLYPNPFPMGIPIFRGPVLPRPGPFPFQGYYPGPGPVLMNPGSPNRGFMPYTGGMPGYPVLQYVPVPMMPQYPPRGG